MPQHATNRKVERKGCLGLPGSRIAQLPFRKGWTNSLCNAIIRAVPDTAHEKMPFVNISNISHLLLRIPSDGHIETAVGRLGGCCRQFTS